MNLYDNLRDVERLKTLQEIANNIKANRKNIEAEKEYKKKEKAMYAAKKRRWLKESIK